MDLIDLGPLGTDVPPPVPSWDALVASSKWREVIRCLVPDGSPTDVQALGLGKFQLLASRRNLIVSAPTNSGKTLLGYLVLLDALSQGRRALLIEPLRAIAQEKFEELTAKAKDLETPLGQKIEVVISTGDYRINEELLDAPPPTQGQLVIATPERLEAILRNPDYEKWITSFGAVCVDEAHLISSPRRGPALEFVLTTLLQSANPPRVALLSATFQVTDAALRWLAPCDFIYSAVRAPSLQRIVAKLGEGEDANEFICSRAAEILKDSSNSLLVFVYRTNDATVLAKRLSSKLGNICGTRGALAYHSKMPLERRQSVKNSYLGGESRCVIASTALAAGVNLPTTHLIVRDISFFGSGPVPIDQLIQMSGRAGRGQSTGHATIIHRPNDLWKSDQLVEELKAAKLPGLVSSFTLRHLSGRNSDADEQTRQAAGFILSLLARAGPSGYTEDRLRSIVKHSLAGQDLVTEVGPALQWLCDSSRMLAHTREDGSVVGTSLGLAATRSSLPLNFAAGFGQLMRDLLSLDEKEDALHAWSPLDHLLIVELLAERGYALRRFSSELREQLVAWAEGDQNPKSVLYGNWIRGDATSSQAIDLLGSLGIQLGEREKSKSEEAWRLAHQAYFRSVVLWGRANGSSIDDLQRRWKFTELEGIEEGWRDGRLWLLGGLGNLCDIKCFFYHLKSEYPASEDPINRAKMRLKRMRLLAFECMERVRLCSPLGSLVAQLRSASVTGIGAATIKALESAGVTSLPAISCLSASELHELGIRKSTAEKLLAYVRRRRS